jgi:hypothetical protein
MSSLPAVWGGFERRRFQSPLFSQPFSAGLIRVMTAVIAWMLVGVHLMTPSMSMFQFHPSFFMATAAVIWCWRVAGPRVFARTPIDLFFGAWLVLAVTSEVWAGVKLHRNFGNDDLINYLQIIMTLWMTFRAAYGLTIVDPKTAGGALLKAIIFWLGFACVIGMLQSGGPLKSQAISFGEKFGASADAVESAVELQSPRPIALFSGPNFFGFMNLVGCTAILAFTMYRGKSISPWNIGTSVFGLFLFIGGTVVAQSRAALAAEMLLVCLFLYLMLRIGRIMVFAAGILTMGIGLVGGIYLISNLQLDYLSGTFDKKIQDDGSFMERERGLNAFSDQAADLSVLGSGWTARAFSLDRTGDKWSKTNSIDNGFFQAYINHGVFGVIHLLYLFFACWLAIRASKHMRSPNVRLMRDAAVLMLITYVLYSASGVRHAKLETAVYWMLVYGSLYGLVHLEQKHQKEVRRALQDHASLELMPQPL